MSGRVDEANHKRPPGIVSHICSYEQFLYILSEGAGADRQRPEHIGSTWHVRADWFDWEEAGSGLRLFSQEALMMRALQVHVAVGPRHHVFQGDLNWCWGGL